LALETNNNIQRIIRLVGPLVERFLLTWRLFIGSKQGSYTHSLAVLVDLKLSTFVGTWLIFFLNVNAGHVIYSHIGSTIADQNLQTDHHGWMDGWMDGT
jgi:hypothetical protein